MKPMILSIMTFKFAPPMLVTTACLRSENENGMSALQKPAACQNMVAYGMEIA
jgi:hypothetical protein